MVISIALLGFGAAGSVVAIFRNKLLQNINILLPFLMIASGIAMAVVTDISQLPQLRFDSYLLFAEYRHIGRLLLTYLLFFVPFFLGALAIGLVFVKYVDNIGKIYFANLLGSGAGGLLALALIWLLFPKQLPAYISILPVIAGILILPASKKVLYVLFAFLAVAVITWKILNPPQLHLSEYKDLSKTLLLPEAQINSEKTSPYGVVQTVSSPVLRYAPGMSLTAQTTAQVKMVAFLNGDWFGVVTDWKHTDTSHILDYTTLALPYRINERNDVLIMRAGTAIDVTHALSENVNRVVAVEPNAIITSTLKNELASETDSLLYHPKVSVYNIESRTFLLTDTSKYDLISLPIIGTFGGSAGLYALQEQFFLTKEAFREMWLKLKPGGVISVTSWMDYPIRNPLKVLSTLVEVLDDLKIPDPKNHIAAVRSWGTITFTISRSALTETEVANIRDFCDEMMFDPAILPGLKPEERTVYNEFQDNRFFEYVDKIISGKREDFYNNYDFNIKPATDNKPYFSQFIKWGNLSRIAGFFGNRSLPFFEIGYLLVIVTLIQITVASFLLILLPLFKLGWRGANKFNIILYFTGIGLGFMFVEMVFIQRFILYFGNPVYSVSAVITTLLIFSGAGSYFSRNIVAKPKGLLVVLAFIVGLLLVYSIILTPVLQQTIHWQLPFKVFIVLLLTAPLAFLMGIPFPAGLAKISESGETEVPWAWGINGCVSVISTALATIISVELGFIWVMVLAALAYCLPLTAHYRWR